jgi:hypothetical protein
LAVPWNREPRQLRVSNSYCPIKHFNILGGDSAGYVKGDNSISREKILTMFIKTDVVEPKTITFTIQTVLNGHGVNGKSHLQDFLATVEIRGCPNERQFVTIPGLRGNWDQHQTDILPKRTNRTMTLPDPSTFAYSNRFCPFVKYHIYQDYPTLIDKMRGEYACGPIASTTPLDTLEDIEHTYKSNFEMILAKCQKSCNDSKECKRFAFGKAGAKDEKTCYLYNSEVCGYKKYSGFKNIYIPSKLTQNIFIKKFDGQRTITYTDEKDGSFWFQLGVETVGGHISMFPSQMLIQSPQVKAKNQICEEHKTNLLQMITPRDSELTCNEECVKDLACDHFNYNAKTKQCELQKKGYCKKLIEADGWTKYEATEHVKANTNGPKGHGTHCVHYPEFGNDKVQVATCRAITSKATCESANHPECAWVEAKVKYSNYRCNAGITLTTSPPSLEKCNERCVKTKDCFEFSMDGSKCQYWSNTCTSRSY